MIDIKNCKAITFEKLQIMQNVKNQVIFIFSD